MIVKVCDISLMKIILFTIYNDTCHHDNVLLVSTQKYLLIHLLLSTPFLEAGTIKFLTEIFNTYARKPMKHNYSWQDWQYKYNIILTRLCATNVAVKKQEALCIMSVRL